MRGLTLIAIGLLIFSSAPLQAAKRTKKDFYVAKKECLKEDPALKGGALQKCILKRLKKLK